MCIKHPISYRFHSLPKLQRTCRYSVVLPEKPLMNIELSTYAQELQIPHFRDVFMRDTLQQNPYSIGCVIVNSNTSNPSGSHWVCYYRNKSDRSYFDSYGQRTPSEIQRYLKTSSEFDRGKEVIQSNTDIVQAFNKSVCGHLCLFVLKSLTSGEFPK